jgi:hypothetical protein
MNRNRPHDGEQGEAWRTFRWLPPVMTMVWILALVAWIVAGQMPRVGLVLAVAGAGVWVVGSGMVILEVIRRRKT